MTDCEHSRVRGDGDHEICLDCGEVTWRSDIAEQEWVSNRKPEAKQ